MTEEINEGGNYHETVEKMLAAWDADEIVWTVEMGGMGPGYEQAIQVGVMEMCRKMQNGCLVELKFDEEKQEPIETYSPEFKAASHEVNDEQNLGLSGAQAGAMMQIAFRFLTDGPRKALLSMKETDPDRLIMVTKNFPGAAA